MTPNKRLHYSYSFHLLIFISVGLQKYIWISTQENFLILDITSLRPWTSQIQVQRLMLALKTDADPHWNLINALNILLRIHCGPLVGSFTQKRQIKSLQNVFLKVKSRDHQYVSLKQLGQRYSLKFP